ncbi:hypothetical protein EXIGLDRAFT_763034 [Exidia glandulosa HHB12029]|uniref:Transmembrane protein n=1 Tax=Exidia glandulosa HHB12029 TaxID=1314781 RepID=A0A165MBQ2_EXIGL|nr:hypothetical protein EXIGLDRAFT_763034 [Exidia glandulosa HHB12029]
MSSTPARAVAFVLHPILSVHSTTASAQARPTDNVENNNIFDAFNMRSLAGPPAPAYVTAPAQSQSAGRAAPAPRSTTFAVGRPSSTESTLPPYAPPGHTLTVDNSGAYSTSEPPTMARELFKYGFFLPLFWIIGITILFSDLKPPLSGWEDKTEDERQRLLASLRQTEVKWARRCLYALFTFLALIGLVAIVLVLVLSHRK